MRYEIPKPPTEKYGRITNFIPELGILVLADDKTVEKRDRTVNEPIQFLTSKARQPYEIVVNNVGKDVISGYLSTPKVTNAR